MIPLTPRQIQTGTFIGIAVIVLIAVLIITGVIPGLKESGPEVVTVRVWSVEPADAWGLLAGVIAERQPGITLVYEQKDPRTYDAELLDALASGTGPDVFTLPNAGLERQLSKIVVLPPGAFGFTAEDFRASFFDGASSDLITANREVIGIPYVVDPLALFYNRDYFNTANIPAPPKTWDDFIAAVQKLTVLSETGMLVRPAAAIGSAGNVSHFLDILAGLFLQSGLDIVGRGERTGSDLGGASAESALAFYTAFADAGKRTYTWSPSFPSSFDAFAQGKTAMVFGFASDVPLIFQKNPHLSFDTARFPQFTGAPASLFTGRYRVLAVSRQSPAASSAWSFLLSFADPAVAGVIPGAVALAPAERTVATGKAPASYLQPFYDEVLSLKTWRIIDEAAFADIFKEMIESVVAKQATPGTAIGRAAGQIGILTKSP